MKRTLLFFYMKNLHMEHDTLENFIKEYNILDDKKSNQLAINKEEYNIFSTSSKVDTLIYLFETV